MFNCPLACDNCDSFEPPSTVGFRYCLDISLASNDIELTPRDLEAVAHELQAVLDSNGVTDAGVGLYSGMQSTVDYLHVRWLPATQSTVHVCYEIVDDDSDNVDDFNDIVDLLDDAVDGGEAGGDVPEGVVGVDLPPPKSKITYDYCYLVSKSVDSDDVGKSLSEGLEHSLEVAVFPDANFTGPKSLKKPPPPPTPKRARGRGLLKTSKSPHTHKHKHPTYVRAKRHQRQKRVTWRVALGRLQLTVPSCSLRSQLPDRRDTPSGGGEEARVSASERSERANEAGEGSERVKQARAQRAQR
jgi:hypothetical protein